MSQPNSANYGGYAPPAHKPESNIYTMMLVLSFLLLVTASVLCHFELQKFGKDFPQWRVSGSVPAVGS
jgi:hypothetical protein